MLRRLMMLALCALPASCCGTLMTRSSATPIGWPLFEAVHADAWFVSEGSESVDAYFRLFVWMSFPIDLAVDVVLLPIDAVAGIGGWRRNRVPSGPNLPTPTDREQ